MKGPSEDREKVLGPSENREKVLVNEIANREKEKRKSIGVTGPTMVTPKFFSGRVCTLYNVILRIARNFLETRENIKISTHSFYHINLD
jgi:hypothetical protein